MKQCTVGIDSPTLALRGRALLKEHGIDASPVRRNTAKGCGGGLEVPCERLTEARELLRRGGIPTDGGLPSGDGREARRT